jgi:transposase InsO family protein
LATAIAAGHDLSWQPGQYTSWAFGHRLRQARLPGSMGGVASVDNAMIESFWPTM